MLIPDISSRIRFTYTGVNTFNIPYPFYDLESIRVQVFHGELNAEELVYGVDYSVDGLLASGDQDNTQAYINGTVTLTATGVAKIVTNDTLAVYRVTEPTQDYQYNELDNFPAKSHENALGKSIALIQELQDQVDRSIKLSESNPSSPEELLQSIYDARDTATDKAAEALESAADAQSSEDDAAISEANAKTSEDAAAASAADSLQSANDSAASAAAAASSAADAASSASDSDAAAAAALASQNAAVTSETNAATSAAAALASQNAAASSATTAASSASDAEDSAALAFASQNAASVSEANALQYSNDSNDYAELSRQWAENPENTEVTPGHYSSYHWSKKAEEAAGGGGTVVSVNSIEPNPATKDVQITYYVTVAEYEAQEIAGTLVPGARYVRTDAGDEVDGGTGTSTASQVQALSIALDETSAALTDHVENHPSGGGGGPFRCVFIGETATSGHGRTWFSDGTVGLDAGTNQSGLVDYVQANLVFNPVLTQAVLSKRLWDVKIHHNGTTLVNTNAFRGIAPRTWEWAMTINSYGCELKLYTLNAGVKLNRNQIDIVYSVWVCDNLTPSAWITQFY